MRNLINLLLIFLLLDSQISFAKDETYTLVDKVCATVGQERPILLSEVLTRANNTGNAPKDAQRELIKERSLIIYAKKMVTYNAPRIKKEIEGHISGIIENNKLTKERFITILHGPPYNMSLGQFEYETSLHLHKNMVEASITSSIKDISPEEVEKELEKRKSSRDEFLISFITIKPDVGGEKKDSLSNQFEKAKKIREEIERMKNLDELKRKYAGHKDVSIGEPTDYEEGSLLPQYELQLKKNKSLKVTEPFSDNGAVTMIMKTEKKVVEKTALENVRNDLYKRSVQERLSGIIDNTLAQTPVSISCEW